MWLKIFFKKDLIIVYLIEEYRGRMMSINQLSWGSAAIGSLLLGSIAEKISIWLNIISIFLNQLEAG